MADGTISTADGSRIANGLGIMRQCLETATLERLERRLGELERGDAAQQQDGFSYGNTAHDRAAGRTH
jgi:hypothetical protein